MQREKQCTKCGETKPLDGFHRDKTKADGRRPRCKECEREYDRRYREENRDKVLDRRRRYYEENRDKLLDRRRRYYEENRDYLNSTRKKYHHSYHVTSVSLAEKHGQPYTPDEDALLLCDNGMTVYQKAVTLGRAYESCRGRLERLRAREAVDV